MKKNFFDQVEGFSHGLNDICGPALADRHMRTDFCGFALADRLLRTDSCGPTYADRHLRTRHLRTRNEIKNKIGDKKFKKYVLQKI
uniref:Uncharacterized protein n=1 Tax=Meloidogyne enterolobii TaxID=390850 RepID=A0A6V7VMT8_MELEN|nr:unnamed protein product [Meloidogyne enterolobii]